ncbi:hypothetical protein U1Q18_017585 [Sarracenia purpurea var. burkii]
MQACASDMYKWALTLHNIKKAQARVHNTATCKHQVHHAAAAPARVDCHPIPAPPPPSSCTIAATTVQVHIPSPFSNPSLCTLPIACNQLQGRKPPVA